MSKSIEYLSRNLNENSMTYLITDDNFEKEVEIFCEQSITSIYVFRTLAIIKAYKDSESLVQNLILFFSSKNCKISSLKDIADQIDLYYPEINFNNRYYQQIEEALLFS